MERAMEIWPFGLVGSIFLAGVFVCRNSIPPIRGLSLSGYKDLLATILFSRNLSLHFFLPYTYSSFTMLQSILTRLLLESSNGSATLRDWGGFASVILLLSAFLYKVLYVPASSLGRDHSPPLLKLPSWKVSQFFFEKRFDFIKDGFKATSSAIYQTKLFRHNAIVLSGDEGRQTFFKEKGLCLYDTFSIMMGSVSLLAIDFDQVITHFSHLERRSL
jgi:hypothetical protein